jgi:nucleoid DNA-binding protein
MLPKDTITTRDLVGLVSAAGLSKKDAAIAIRAIADIIVAGIQSGKTVRIAGLGTFRQAMSPAGTRSAPKKGGGFHAPKSFPAKVRIAFRSQDGALE